MVFLTTKMLPKASKNRSKIDQNDFWLFDWFFKPILVPFWEPFFIIFASQNRSESEKAILWKWASRVHEVLIFKDFGPQDLSKNRWKKRSKNGTLFWAAFGCFGERFCDHFGIKIASKNRSKNQCDFGSIFGRFWAHPGVHVGSPSRSGMPPGRPQDAPRRSQDAPKMLPRRSRMPIRHPKRPQEGPTHLQARFYSNFHRFSLVFHWFSIEFS